MPSPGGQAPGWPEKSAGGSGWQGAGCLVVIPSPDLMAITPRRGRKPGNACAGIKEGCGPDTA